MPDKLKRIVEALGLDSDGEDETESRQEEDIEMDETDDISETEDLDDESEWEGDGELAEEDYDDEDSDDLDRDGESKDEDEDWDDEAECSCGQEDCPVCGKRRRRNKVKTKQSGGKRIYFDKFGRPRPIFRLPRMTGSPMVLDRSHTTEVINRSEPPPEPVPESQRPVGPIWDEPSGAIPEGEWPEERQWLELYYPEVQDLDPDMPVYQAEGMMEEPGDFLMPQDIEARRRREYAHVSASVPEDVFGELVEAKPVVVPENPGLEVYHSVPGWEYPFMDLYYGYGAPCVETGFGRFGYIDPYSGHSGL